MGENKPTHILLVEDSLEGILSAVSYAYKSRYGHAHNKIMIDGEDYTMELFSEYLRIPTDSDVADKVYKAIRSKLGLEFLEYIEYCARSSFEDKGEVIYRCLILGFANEKLDVLNYRQSPYVTRLNSIYRNVLNENYHWREFLRFKIHDMDLEARDKLSPALLGDYTSMEQYRKTASHQLLSALIEPKHRILTLMTPYFADRYPSENFIIYDKTFDEAAVHPSGEDWYIIKEVSVSHAEILEIIGSESEENSKMADLWKIFFDTTFIKERENRALQRSLMPLRFRGDMPEQQ